ncbi:tRNA dihydrouridine synthase DusB [Geodermatophilus sp. YIM 151500]|uniref:tRNA dihydrouridine synthase DusB n=1 Tax=Geodermatophilus sp. YIM 151500 TaxID=2984531 RepID=UPI0021E3D307|nr:tRNA dihydrouridine synthase DusB [Geodermatophilus sp. YIM 151500]MCV2489754.1 tRNA dihydrouridine synthase DusB [Geodermatophilus sp. YIM 151500]
MTSTLAATTTAALPALKLGALAVDPAVVLAPMAGITNPAFRTLCREFGAGLYVCEMITTRALVERNEKTLQMVRATADERDAFSVQLYGVDPATVGRAVEMLVDEQVAGTRPAHVDLNFGCPVPKVTRKGGGAALPWRRRLFRDIVRAAVRAARDVPVTVKTRVGIDAEHVTYLEAGRIAQDEGAAAITLHGRTADQLYSGTADWTHIARLVEAVDVPVLGNGDVWEADDALRMVAGTGCAGVVIGRGCLGRPWLFGDLAAAFAGRTERALPTLREVAGVMLRHAQLLSEEQGELHGCTDFRKHVAWYLKGFAVGGDVRRALAMVSGLDELAGLLARIPDQPYPADVLGAPRGRTSPPRPVALPEGWLADRDDPRPPAGAELLVGGG